MKRILHGVQMAYGTNLWSFCVYESNGPGFPPHSTITGLSDLGYPKFSGFAGRLGTRQLPRWMDAIPYSPRRSKVVRRFHRAQWRAAYKLILANLPKWAKGRMHASMGEISIHVSTPVLATPEHSINIPLN